MWVWGKDILLPLVRLVWPDTCIGCGTNEPTRQGFCQHCSAELLSLAALDYCPRCGRTVGPGLHADADGCWQCPNVMFRFNRAVRVSPYADPLRPAIRRMKYRRWTLGLRELGVLLAEALSARCADLDLHVVLPVPMHWLRRLGRGSNHATGLAQAVAKRLRLPVSEDLIRTRNTPPQVGLPASRREANVRGAFAVPRPQRLDGATVLLVDDIMTTGATANEATRALLSAGAEHVTVAVLARAEPPTAYSQTQET